MTEKAGTKKVRDMGEYDPKCDALIIYIAVGAAIIGAVSISIWSIHTFLGWWNFFSGIAVLVLLAAGFVGWVFRYELGLFFGEERNEEVVEAELLSKYTPEELAEADEVMSFLNSSAETQETTGSYSRMFSLSYLLFWPLSFWFLRGSLVARDETDRAEAVLWWGLCLAPLGVLLLGRLSPDSSVTGWDMVIGYLVGYAGLMWMLLYRGFLDEQ
jgi:hypothetical protein